MRILLLGKQGQVGAELLPLLAHSHELTALGRSDLDLADEAALRAALVRVNPNLVINAAAYTAVDRAESDGRTALAINRDVPALLATELKARGGALLHFSTDYVFDGKKNAPYAETDVPAPLNEYGRSKLAGEQAIAASGCAHLIIRTSWIYGAHGENFCRMIGRFARTRTQLDVVNDQTGSPTSAKTLARVTTRLIELFGDSLFTQQTLLHVAGAGAATRHELAQQVVQALVRRFGAAVKTRSIAAVGSERFPAPALRPANSALSIDRLLGISGIDLAPWQQDVAEFVATSPETIWT